MAIGVICAGGIVFAECAGQPVSNAMTTGLTGIITGAWGYMQRPQQQQSPPPPGTVEVKTTQTATSTPPEVKP